MLIIEAFQSQYKSALQMLRASIEQCPDSLWDDASYGNRFWHIAYHGLHYAALYLAPTEEAFVPWSGARANYQFLGPNPWNPDLVIPDHIPYTREELSDFIVEVESRLDTAFSAVPMDAPSGFSWISFNRFHLYVYNLRHLQHHIGQLTERIRQVTGSGVQWVGRVG